MVILTNANVGILVLKSGKHIDKFLKLINIGLLAYELHKLTRSNNFQVSLPTTMSQPSH